MVDKKEIDFSDIEKLLLSKDDFLKKVQDFHSKIVPFLKKNRRKMLTIKGAPEIPAISSTYGPYLGKIQGLYISKNDEHPTLKDIELRAFFQKVEKILLSKFGEKIFWRTNLLINTKTGVVDEVEFFLR